MRHSARRRKLCVGLALGLAWFAALVVPAVEPAPATAADLLPGSPSADGRHSLRVALRPGDTPKANKASKTQKDKKSTTKPSTIKSRTTETPDRAKEPTTFAEAFERGKQLLVEFQGAIDGLRLAEDQKNVDENILDRLRDEKRTEP